MEKTTLKVGLLGLGRMGQNHLRVLSMLRGVEINFLFDSDKELCARLAQANGVIDASANLDNFLNQVDAVIIVTPTITHADYIRQCGRFVKNIFVEKPLTSTLDEALEISALVKQRALNLRVGFIERFNPTVQGLKSVLERSQGVISVDFTRTNKLSARITDVDVILDLMIHDIDLALYLNGPAKTVAAHGYSSGALIDFVSALITHENGTFSRIQASRITDKKKRSIEATCIDSFVDCDLLRKEIIINRQSQIQENYDAPYTISAIQESVEVSPQEALLSELQSFISSCHGEVERIPGVDDGIAAMLLCEQIKSRIIL